jgi:hypothetical protein
LRATSLTDGLHAPSGVLICGCSTSTPQVG